MTRVRRADVVDAARAILDEKGDDGLTMAGVAGRLGLTTMAVYRHVRDRAELVDAAVDATLAELAAEPAEAEFEPWLDGVDRWMRDVRSQLLAHPWVGPALGTGSTLRPGWLGAVVRLTRVLDRSPLVPARRARAVIWITRVTVGVVMQEARAPLPHAAADPSALLEQLAEEDREVLAPLAADLAEVTNDDLFADLLVETRHYLEGMVSG